MERRLNLKIRIERALTHIATRVHISKNFTDVNLLAEDTLKNMFNLVYGYNLKNLNYNKINESTIDLIFPEEKLAYQITSRNDTTKIKETVNSFIKYKKYKHITKLIIFSISVERKCSDAALNTLQKYNVKGKYLNMTDFLAEIFERNEVDNLEIIAELFESEISINQDYNHYENIKAIPNLESFHIIEQIEKVLDIFKGFNCIYPRTIARLYPFNIGNDSFNSYSELCLKTNNVNIFNFLNKIEVKDYKLKIKDKSINQFEAKIIKIFKILNKSFIHSISYISNNKKIECTKINITPNDINCNCKFDKFYNFNYSPLLNLLKEKSITPSKDGAVALEEAFYLGKIGEHIKAWQILNNISKNSKNFVSVFLSLNNQKNIFGFINSYWWANENKSIIPEINSIDLDNVFCKIKLTTLLRDELIRVKEDYFLHYSRRKIDKFYDEILNTKMLYSNGGFRIGASTSRLLLYEIYIVSMFHISNSITIDDFKEFKNVIERGIEGLFISYSTDSGLEGKYDKFDYFILILIIFYLDEDKLIQISNNNDINIIKIYESDKIRFIETVNNFFTFQFKKGIFNSLKYNEYISHQNPFSSFRQSLKHFFNKIMLLLTLVNIADEDIKEITQSLLYYLKVAIDFNDINWDYFVHFFRARSKTFNLEQFKYLIEILVQKVKSNTNIKILDKICLIASTENSFILDSEIILNYLKSNLVVSKRECINVDNSELSIAFWPVSDIKTKKILFKKLTLELTKEFNAELFQKAVYKNIFTKENSPILYDKFINYTVSVCKENDFIYDREKWKFRDFTGSNCINCLYYLDANFKDDNLQKISKQSDYYNWLVNYKEFDYKYFDVSWLYNAPYYLKIKLNSVNIITKMVLKKINIKRDEKLLNFITTFMK